MRLSPRMAANRPINADNCKSFWPFNEGAGTTFTDAITGAVATDASATHTGNAHAPAVLSTSLTGVADGFITIPAGSIFAFIVGVKAVVAGAFIKHILGAVTGPRLKFAPASFEVEDDSGATLATAELTGVNDTQKQFVMLIVDQAAGVAYVHESIDGAASARVQTISSGIPTDSITIPAQISMSNGTRQQLYGQTVHTLLSLPTEAECNAVLDFCYAEWSRGRKILPPQFA